MMQKPKRKPWAPSAENLLLKMWGENIGALRGPRKKSHIYREMAVEMDRLGIRGISAADINTKIKNLTTKYRKTKNLVGVSEGSSSGWVHFDTVHQIIGNIPINKTNIIVEKAAPMDSTSSREQSIVKMRRRQAELDEEANAEC